MHLSTQAIVAGQCSFPNTPHAIPSSQESMIFPQTRHGVG